MFFCCVGTGLGQEVAISLTEAQQEAVAQLKVLKTVADSLLALLPEPLRSEMRHELGRPPSVAFKPVQPVEPLTPAKPLQPVKPVVVDLAETRPVDFLSVFDENRDGHLDAADVAFWQAARIWRDPNRDQRMADSEVYGIDGLLAQIQVQGRTFTNSSGQTGALFARQYLILDLGCNGLDLGASTDDGMLVLDADRLKGMGMTLFSQWGVVLTGFVPLRSGMSVQGADGRRVQLNW